MLSKIKTVTGRTALGLVIAAALIAGIGVATVLAAGPGPRGPNSGEGVCLQDLELADLSDEEIEGILFMREEEKLARDVYQMLYEEWELRAFQNIAASEQAHMDALAVLIERYGLDDPTLGSDRGEFQNSELQNLYNELVEQGKESLESALRVGATVEEIDIVDLEELVDETDATDVLRVYENLLRGSRNHLRAFVGTLERQTGESYSPQHMGQDAYDDVLAGSVETGQMGQRNGRGDEAAAGEGYGRNAGKDPVGRGARSAGQGRGAGAAAGERQSRQSRGLGEGDCLQQ